MSVPNIHHHFRWDVWSDQHGTENVGIECIKRNQRGLGDFVDLIIEMERNLFQTKMSKEEPGYLKGDSWRVIFKWQVTKLGRNSGGNEGNWSIRQESCCKLSEVKLKDTSNVRWWLNEPLAGSVLFLLYKSILVLYHCSFRNCFIYNHDICTFIVNYIEQ